MACNALIALLTFMKCANNTSFESRDLDEINLEAQQTCFYQAFNQAILLSNFQLFTVN
jgi:hypothetical protein